MFLILEHNLKLVVAPCNVCRSDWTRHISDTHTPPDKRTRRNIRRTSVNRAGKEGWDMRQGCPTATSPDTETHMLCIQRLNWPNVSFSMVNVYFSSTSWDNWIILTAARIRTVIWTLLRPLNLCNIQGHNQYIFRIVVNQSSTYFQQNNYE